MRKRIKALALLSVVSLIFTGCSEGVYEMTDEERQIIVDYSAHIITKYNIRQAEGYTYVYMADEEEEEDYSEFEEEVASAEEENSEEEASKAEETKEEAKNEENATPSAPTTPSNNSNGYVTLTEALGFSSIEATMEKAYYSLKYDSYVPELGKGMIVVKVNLKNMSNNNIEVDLLSHLPVFKARINDSVNVTAPLTILLDDLGTYQGNIPSGGTAETVILFPLKTDDITEVTDLVLSVEMGGNTKKVKLL